MESEIGQLLAGLQLRSGATEAMIAECESQLHLKFPADYIEFLRLSDGGEGFLGGSAYVILWPIGELAQTNESYNVREQAPGLLLFGSDGGGEAYGFDTRTKARAVVQVPFIGMEWGAALPIGATFFSFLRTLSAVDH